jgi:iron complex transport system ATP-binding protein
VTLDGQDISRIAKKQLARRVAFVEQHGMTDANMRVRDVVKLGRIPHHSAFPTGARTMTRPSPRHCNAWICWIKATRAG